MIGELAGLGAALCWACSSLVIKPMSTRFSVFSLNSIRSLGGWVFLLVILLPMGKVTSIADIPATGLWYVTISGIVGVVVGTTLYIKSLSLLDINRTYPVTYGCWLLSAAIIAAVFLNETITWFTVMGAIIVIAGIVILVTGGTDSTTKTSQRSDSIGFICAILGGLCWTGGGAMLKLGISLVNPYMVNIIRIPVIVIFLFILTLRQSGITEFKKYDFSSWARASLGGVFDQGVGAILYFVSIQLAGMAKATILSSASPLFVAPLSVILLKEKLTWRCALGTVLCVSGIWLTVIK